MSKHTALRVLIGMILACVIVGSITTEADAAERPSLKGTCSYLTWSNMYVTADEFIDYEELMASNDWIGIHRCHVAGMRLEKAMANKWSEIRQLKKMVSWAPGTNYMLCRTGKSSAYMLNLAWRTNGFWATKHEETTWPSWARRYAAAHGCHF